MNSYILYMTRSFKFAHYVWFFSCNMYSCLIWCCNNNVIQITATAVGSKHISVQKPILIQPFTNNCTVVSAALELIQQITFERHTMSLSFETDHRLLKSFHRNCTHYNYMNYKKSQYRKKYSSNLIPKKLSNSMLKSDPLHPSQWNTTPHPRPPPQCLHNVYSPHPPLSSPLPLCPFHLLPPLLSLF